MFLNSREKLVRAATHIEQIAKTFDDYLTGGLVHLQAVTEPGDMQIMKVIAEGPPPRMLPLMIGDAFHNLRCSLDHLTSELLRTKDKVSKTTFPMHMKQGNLKDLLDKSPITAAYPQIADVIMNLEPYEKDEPGLWHIGHFDNIDKHNLILPTIVVSGVEGACFETDGCVNFGVSLFVEGTGECRGVGHESKTPFVITDPGRVRGALTFPAPGRLRGLNVVAVLAQLTELTHRAINKFDEFVGANGVRL
jgi:hypothetical protein